MILAVWNDQWALAQRLRSGLTGCSLSVRTAIGPSLLEFGFEQFIHKTFWHKYFPSTDGITFYPEIYYRGCRIWPQWWDSERQEPILRCIALPSNLEDLDSDYFREIAGRISARYAGDVLIADGWEQIGRGEYVKFLHVDEIEKVEAPPPEVPF